MMKLRHKKPINSYVGQANIDSHQISDEDFQKNATGVKRPKINKQRVNNEQTRKYAQILTSFVQTINTDYENFSNKFVEKIGPVVNSLSEIHQLETSKSKNVVDGGIGYQKIPVASKQQLNIINVNKGKQVILAEKQAQKSKQIAKQVIKKQVKNKVTASEFVSINEKKNVKSKGREELELMSSDNQKPQNSQPQPNYGQIPLQNGPYSSNPAIYRSYPYLSMAYQQLMEQLKYSSNMPISQLQMYQNQYMHHLLSMGLQNCSIPFSQLSFYDQIKRNTQSYAMESLRCQTAKQPQQTEIPVKPLKTNSLKILNKRSNFHISIAYGIHYKVMKSMGKVPNSQNWGYESPNFDKLDPTYPARKIRHNRCSYNPLR